MTPRAVRYMSSSDLISLLRSLPKNPNAVAVVDVRDEDRGGGHIVGSIHAPSETFDVHLHDYLGRLKNVERVVFHCMLSQCRGPSCAARFAKRCDEEFGRRDEVPGGGPKVFVLEEGFSGFVRRHGKEKDLLEAFEESRHPYY